MTLSSTAHVITRIPIPRQFPRAFSISRCEGAVTSGLFVKSDATVCSPNGILVICTGVGYLGGPRRINPRGP